MRLAYTSCQGNGLFQPSGLLIRDRKVGSARSESHFVMADTPHQRQLGLLHGQRLLVVLYREINRVRAASLRRSEPCPSPAGHVRLPARPRERAPRRRGTVARTGCTCSTGPTSHSWPFAQLVLLGLLEQNLRLLKRRARRPVHVREETPSRSRHAHPRTRPSPVFQWRDWVQMAARLALRVVSAPSTATTTASLYFLSAWYCSALPPRCIFLHICLWPRRQWSCWHVESQ